jgi:hypothetical protein
LLCSLVEQTFEILRAIFVKADRLLTIHHNKLI